MGIIGLRNVGGRNPRSGQSGSTEGTVYVVNVDVSSALVSVGGTTQTLAQWMAELAPGGALSTGSVTATGNVTANGSLISPIANIGSVEADILDAASSITTAGILSATGAIEGLKGTAIPAGGYSVPAVRFSDVEGFGLYFGSGVPTIVAAQGSLYIRSDGVGVNTRLYVNTNGTNGWAAVTTVS